LKQYGEDLNISVPNPLVDGNRANQTSNKQFIEATPVEEEML
jgi:hypothetical protein